MEKRKYKWTFEGFHTQLAKLDSVVGERALEIAGKLMDTGDFTKERAIEEGIDLAKELFYDFEDFEE